MSRLVSNLNIPWVKQINVYVSLCKSEFIEWFKRRRCAVMSYNYAKNAKKWLTMTATLRKKKTNWIGAHSELGEGEVGREGGRNGSAEG